MSFSSNFKLNEIQFSNNNNNNISPDYNSLDRLSNSLTLRRYPENLGTAGTNHYILFEIFIRENSNPDLRTPATEIISGDDPKLNPVSYQITNLLSRTRGNQNILNQANVQTSRDLSTPTINEARSQWNNRGNAVAGFGNNGSGGPSEQYLNGQRSAAMSNRIQQTKNDVSFSIPRLKKTREVIALYMPDTGLQFNYSQNYDDSLSATSALGAPLAAAQLGLAGASAYSKFSQGGGYVTPLKQLSPFAVEALSKVMGREAGSLVMSNFGVAINPSFEVIFTGTKLRNFSFEFMFYPRSEREAETVYRIIQAFKFHSSPEITKDTAGRYLLAPSAFDIKFMYNGLENPNIPKISTCVCNSVNVDYAPNGFAAYEVQGNNEPGRGKTGTPVATRLTLQFTEITMITKELLRGSVLNNSEFEGAF